MRCRKCGEEAVILVPVKYFVHEYTEKQEGMKRTIVPSLLKRIVMWIRGEAYEVVEIGPTDIAHGHMEEHQEGRCEQCWKAERMSDNVPEIEDGTP